MEKTGIYIIKNTINSKIYIGQSINLNSRISNHKYCLRKNIHRNNYLQNEYNKYKEKIFEFKILEYCSIDKLDEREVFWIKYFDSLNRQNGYNLESGGNKNKIISKETRNKKIGKNNPMYGKKHKKEIIEFIRNNNKGSSDKLNSNDVSLIKNQLLNGVKQRELADNFNVKLSTINKIIKCKNWSWVDSHLNKELIDYQKNKTYNRDKKIIKLWNNHNNFNKISKIMNVDRFTIKNVLLKNNIISC